MLCTYGYITGWLCFLEIQRACDDTGGLGCKDSSLDLRDNFATTTATPRQETGKDVLRNEICIFRESCRSYLMALMQQIHACLTWAYSPKSHRLVPCVANVLSPIDQEIYLLPSPHPSISASKPSSFSLQSVIRDDAEHSVDNTRCSNLAANARALDDCPTPSVTGF